MVSAPSITCFPFEDSQSVEIYRIDVEPGGITFLSHTDGMTVGHRWLSFLFKAVKIENRKDAQNVPTPITTYALFCDGEYVTNEQMNDKKFLKLVGREEKTTLVEKQLE